jgi:hypothetical protein
VPSGLPFPGFGNARSDPQTPLAFAGDLTGGIEVALLEEFDRTIKSQLLEDRDGVVLHQTVVPGECTFQVQIRFGSHGKVTIGGDTFQVSPPVGEQFPRSTLLFQICLSTPDADPFGQCAERPF